jgi:two-component system response regulator MprA
LPCGRSVVNDPFRTFSGLRTKLEEMRILVVDDEAAVRRAVRGALTVEGYEVRLAREGREALDVLASERVDAVVLDLLMPGLDGLEVCRRIRADGDSTPVLMLTVRNLVSDRVAGLDAGADDYLTKPFSLDELLARMRALLRRASGSGEVLRFADLSLDVDTREARRGDRLIRLTPTEFFLLELLLRHPRRVLSREFIFDRVWGYGTKPTSNSLEVYVGYLRRKTEAHNEPRLVHTVHRVGYVLREQ